MKSSAILISIEIILSIFLLKGKAYAIYYQRYRLNGVTYTIYVENNDKTNYVELAKIVNEKLTFVIEKLEKALILRINYPIKISISTKGWIFNQILNKRMGNFSGAYDSEKDIILIQNPKSRRMSLILDKVLSHELSHQLIHHNRKRKPDRIIEELFCEGVFPIKRNFSTFNFSFPKKFSLFYREQKKLIYSKNKRSHQLFYLKSQLLGRYLLKKWGIQKFFLKIKTEDKKDINKLYINYLQYIKGKNSNYQ